MLLRLSRACFWLAAVAAAVALAVPTGRETLLTGVALCGALAAFWLWRSGLGEVRRTQTAHALAPAALSLTQAALDDAARSIERCCEASAGFEATLHGVARILKCELGGMRSTVHRVLGADSSHARTSELIESQPGFLAVERRVHLQRSTLGRAIAGGIETGEPTGTLVVPVCAGGGVVAVIELAGIDIGIDPQALALLLGLARERLSEQAEPVGHARHHAAPGAHPRRGGENG